jgi:NAD(P)-dependent dehydrogenase (short-subunit alcohol dehydrogenase family)
LFLDEKEEDIEKQVNGWHLMTRVMGVNLMGPIWMTKTFLPKMIASGKSGHIVQVASILGLTGCAYASKSICHGSWLADYCASKFGVVGFHEALRQELQLQ